MKSTEQETTAMTETVNPKWQMIFDRDAKRTIKTRGEIFQSEIDDERMTARPELFDIFLVAVNAQWQEESPSDAKRGRNPKFPYVPVINYIVRATGDKRTQNPAKGLAFATREEAVAKAQSYIIGTREQTAFKMTLHRYRALREQYGFASELKDVVAV
jgi:hypothetical protein